MQVSRYGAPASWLVERVQQWRRIFDAWDDKGGKRPSVCLRLEGLGDFTVQRSSSRLHEWVLINPERYDIHLWNVEKWPAAWKCGNAPFKVDFRSKFLQFEGIPGVIAAIDQVVGELVQLGSIEPDNPHNFDRVARIDLAADVQAAFGWADVDRFVTRATHREMFVAPAEGDAKLAGTMGNKCLPTSIATPPPSPRKARRRAEDPVKVYALVADARQDVAPELFRTIGKGALQTCYFGKFAQPLYARLYDKMASLPVQDKGYMLDVWGKVDGFDPSAPVWRVEFSMSSDFLRGVVDEQTGELLELRELVNVLEAIPKLWAYLTGKWLRHAQGVGGRSNSGRWKPTPVWESVMKAFPTSPYVSRRRPQRRADVGRALAQIKGLTVRVGAELAEADGDFSGMWEVVNELRKFCIRPDGRMALAEKRFQLGYADANQRAIDGMMLRAGFDPHDTSDTAETMRDRFAVMLRGRGS